MRNDFMMAINQVCHERQLATDVVLEAVEVALVSAYKRNFGGNQSITAMIDSQSGEPVIFIEKLVVEEIENEKKEILLEDAKKVDPKAELGGVVSVESTPGNFGRIAAQTAKQVILQRIREAERDALYKTYAEREGEIVSGTVHKIDSHQVMLSLGKAEAVLPRSEQIPTENYREGQRLRAYVSSVAKSNRGPQIIVSRTHRAMLRRLLEVEVPEIYNGTVEIKSIAREAGYRSKVAVAALQEGVDPVGSCVGMRGTRIQNIVNELNGEKIDVVQWNPDLSYFIANSLSPAKVMNVMLNDEQGKTAGVVVPDKQLSLAIGKEGQNARLAAKLTGWRIDIKSASEAAQEALETVKENDEIRERLEDRMEIFNLAASIMAEKESAELIDGELNLLSEVIEAVNLAQMAIERERKAEAKAAAKEALKAVDILAEAEAILVGATPSEEEKVIVDVEAPEAVKEEAKLAAEEAVALANEEVTEEVEEPVSEAEEVMAEAEAVLSDQNIEVEPEAQVEETEAEEELEPEEEPLSFEELAMNWRERVESDEDDFDEEEQRERELEKKKARQKKRRLVYDERLGEVVAERRRKRSRRTDDWYDYEEDF